MSLLWSINLKRKSFSTISSPLASATRSHLRRASISVIDRYFHIALILHHYSSTINIDMEVNLAVACNPFFLLLSHWAAAFSLCSYILSDIGMKGWKSFHMIILFSASFQIDFCSNWAKSLNSMVSPLLKAILEMICSWESSSGSKLIKTNCWNCKWTHQLESNIFQLQSANRSIAVFPFSSWQIPAANDLQNK